MKYPIAVALLTLAAPSHTFGQVYKCTDARGKPVFQEAPCDADRNANRVNVSPSSGGFESPTRAAPAAQPDAASRDAPDAPAPQRSQPRPANPAQAEHRRHIKGGMSRDEVIASIGAPDLSQVTTTWGLPGGTRFPTADYAVYEPAAGDDQTRTTIYFVGDVVNRVQRDVVRRSP